MDRIGRFNNPPRPRRDFRPGSTVRRGRRSWVHQTEVLLHAFKALRPYELCRGVRVFVSVSGETRRRITAGQFDIVWICYNSRRLNMTTCSMSPEVRTVSV